MSEVQSRSYELVCVTCVDLLVSLVELLLFYEVVLGIRFAFGLKHSEFTEGNVAPMATR